MRNNAQTRTKNKTPQSTSKLCATTMKRTLWTKVLALFTLFAIILFINVATALAYYQSHNVSELRNIDTDLVMYDGGTNRNIQVPDGGICVDNGLASCTPSAGYVYADVFWKNGVGQVDGDITSVTSGTGTKGGTTDGAATIEFDCSEVASTGLTCIGEVFSVTSPYPGSCGADSVRVTGTCRAIPDCDLSTQTLNYDTTTDTFSCGTDSDSYPGSCGADSVRVAGTCRAIPDCDLSTQTLNYDTTTDTFSCGTDATGVSGSGTTNYVAKFTGASSLGNSVMYDDGSNIGIGTTSPLTKMHILGGTLAVNQSGDSFFGLGIPTTAGLFATGDDWGVYAHGADAGSIGVLGTGVAKGVEGSSTTGIGVYGTTSSGYAGIFTGGNVGIGTTSPDAQLEVKQTSTSDILELNNNSRSVMFVDDQGNLGVGVNNANSKITASVGNWVFTGSAGAAISAYSAATSGYSVGYVGYEASSTLHYGLAGYATATSGDNYGVKGKAYGAPDNVGVFGSVDASGTDRIGVYGEVDASDVPSTAGDYAVYGAYTDARFAYLGGFSYPLYAEYDSDTWGYIGSNLEGAYIQYNGTNFGIIGSTTTGVRGSGSIYGVYGDGKTGYGVYGTSTTATGVRGYGTTGGSFYTTNSAGGEYAIISDGILSIEDFTHGGNNYGRIGFDSVDRLFLDPDETGVALMYLHRTNDAVGIGTNSPASKLSVGGAGSSTYGIYGTGSTVGVYGDSSSYGVYGYGSSAAFRGWGWPAASSSYTLCKTTSSTSTGSIGYCSSSRAIKENITDLGMGLDEVMMLRPVEFDYIESAGGEHDFGFIAEDVALVNPLLATYKTNNSIEEDPELADNNTTEVDIDRKPAGVKYNIMTSLLTKAMQEQQQQIEALTAIVCLDHPEADICKE